MDLEKGKKIKGIWYAQNVGASGLGSSLSSKEDINTIINFGTGTFTNGLS
jgi:hypothetical protein